MRWNDLLAQSLQNLWRRKMRTILTIVGVMIGTTSIVIMLSIGLGATHQFEEDTQNMDSLTLITVYDYSANDPSTKNRSKDRIDDTFIRKIEQIPHVVMATPVLRAYPTSANIQVKTRKYSSYGDLQGIRREAFELMDIPIMEGGAPQSESIKPIEIVLGKDSKMNFHKQNSNVWGEEPDIDWFNVDFTLEYTSWKDGKEDILKKYEAKIVGISGNPDSRYYSQYNYGMYMEINALKKLIKENPKLYDNVSTDRYEQCYVKVDDYKNVEKVMDAIKEGNTLAVNSDMEWINASRRQAQSLQLLLGGIGGITMLVAAISIANTMLMSIYERTREIGVMKVLGCRLSNISMLFLGEAGFIGLFGGAVGIGLSYGLSVLLNFIFSYYGGFGGGSMQSYMPPWLAVLALVFAVFVGILSGLYPSQRAMRLSALAAIRNDV